MRVLIVDDNAAARNTLAMLLTMQGCTVDCAEDGQTALERLKGGPRPSVILLDLMMPGMDGWQFLRRKRADPASAAVPVVVLSAAGKSLRQAARSTGADGFLAKPVEADDLLDALARYHDAPLLTPALPP